MTTALVKKEMPDLGVMRDRWAVSAAMRAALFGEPGERGTRAQQHGWYYSDGGGSWAQVILLPQGRAVLVGMDRDKSDTYHEGVDLSVGLPDWALPFLPTAEAGERLWWGFAYVYDGGTWWYHDAGVADGFDECLIPVATADKLEESAADFLDGAAHKHVGDDDPREDAQVSPDTVARAAQLGVDLDESTLLDVLVFTELDLAAGVAAARAFGAVVPFPDTGVAFPYRIGA